MQNLLNEEKEKQKKEQQGQGKKQKKYLATNDLVFRKIFTSVGNEDILKGLINDVYNTEFTEVTIESPYSFCSYKEELEKLRAMNGEIINKLTAVIRDVSAKTNTGDIVSIECQVAEHDFFIERSVFYPAKAYCDNVRDEMAWDYKKGNIYSAIKPVYGINILGFDIFGGGELAVQTFSLVNTETNRCLRNTRGQELLKIAYFGLCNENIVEGSNLIYWRRFFLNQELGEGAPEYVVKAKELADATNLTREENEMISWREEASSILYGEMTFAVRKAKNEGIQATRIENAKNLIEMGLSNTDIAKGTGLLEKDIKDLR